MHSWDSGIGIWGYTLMSISMLLVWGAITAGIVLLARSLRASNQQNFQFPFRRTAEDLLLNAWRVGTLTPRRIRTGWMSSAGNRALS
jgi:putative membrane protein